MSRMRTGVALAGGLGVGIILGVGIEVGSDATAGDQLETIEDCIGEFPLVEGHVTDDLYGCVDTSYPNHGLIERADSAADVTEIKRWLEDQEGIDPAIVAIVATLVVGITVGLIKIGSSK